MRVDNRKCIRRLGRKNLKAEKSRNLIAVLAIALTTMMFTALFTIIMSIGYGFEQSNFRQVGGYAHGGFKYLTQEQFNELKTDERIKEYSLRRFVGMPYEKPFQKTHVEVSYCDVNAAKWMYLNPVEGRLPEENTNEAATDTRVLSLLGVEPVIGNEFTLTFTVDGTQTTETFTLCGYWDYDEAIIASHVLIPESRAEEIYAKLGTRGEDGMTGTYNLDVMLKNKADIERELLTILAEHGYQNETVSDNYIRIGVNWGYMSAQLANNLDIGTVMAIVAGLLLIIFTGYLIIYNVFHISVANDIRRYGLLKTIGTTGRQIRHIVYQEALLLSAVGIPLGLVAGYLCGCGLTPVVVSRLDGIVNVVSASPLIFIGAAVFALVTVLLSCLKPAKIAGRVSPVEAVRYTERNSGSKSMRKTRKGFSLFTMASANLNRNKSKTIMTVVSMSLSVVLLCITCILTKGFDMDKYIGSRFVTDYMVADAAYFQTGNFWGEENALPEEVISRIEEQGSIAEEGRTYGLTGDAREYVTEDWFRKNYGCWNDAETLDRMVELADKQGGRIEDNVQLYGMEPFCLDKLNVFEGDISKLYGEGNYVAAVYMTDDYGDIEPDSIMYYTYNMQEDDGAMESFLTDFTARDMTQLDYESKATYAQEFESFRSMFLIMGGVLSFITGLVGVLNFLNAVLTGILTRRREFAVLQSIGMTGRQLKQMLVYEGLFYALGAAVIALGLDILLSPVMGNVFESMFWFFSYHFTAVPILVVIPVFTLLGIVLPLITYRFAAGKSVVERLREAE